jgi:HTH-type transcriptional regulator/antitoxin HigA
MAPSTVSEVLAGKRRLNRAQIGRLALYFHVDPGVFQFHAFPQAVK